mgnify:FL=1
MTNIHSFTLAKLNKAQKGVVLFFSLIALVVMSLAAVALIRSVDTTSLIAGNLSFRRSATISADSGTETAMAWLKTKNNNLLVNNITSDGYYAVNTANAKTLVNGATAKLATGTGITAGVDNSGNTITYIIQRMCSSTGVADEYKCLLSTNASAQSSKQAGKPIPIVTISKTPVYRVTVKVAGPKNTVSYIQAFLS